MLQTVTLVAGANNCSSFFDRMDKLELEICMSHSSDTDDLRATLLQRGIEWNWGAKIHSLAKLMFRVGVDFYNPRFLNFIKNFSYLYSLHPRDEYFEEWLCVRNHRYRTKTKVHQYFVTHLWSGCCKYVKYRCSLRVTNVNNFVFIRNVQNIIDGCWHVILAHFMKTIMRLQR